MTVTQPMIGADLWRQVIESAYGRCQCEGICGRAHKKDRGRCLTENAARAPLHAVPREPAAGIAAMQLAADDLIALCDTCHGALLALWRKREREAALLREREAPGLFGEMQ